MLPGFLFHGSKWAAENNGCQRGGRPRRKDCRYPLCLPGSGDRHYDEIVRSFGVGALRPPPTPMSDGELARAIAEFLREQPSSESVATLGRRLDPSSRL